jgi:hypothetical protein
MKSRIPEMIVDNDGSRQWYLNGKLHREEGPAVEHPNGNFEWYLQGKLHRTDGPAVENRTLDTRVISNMALRRNRQALRVWYLQGKLHRTDGPAVEWPGGTREYFLHGQLHREDGPAIETSRSDYREWWYKGESYDVDDLEAFLDFIRLLKIQDVMES